MITVTQTFANDHDFTEHYKYIEDCKAKAMALDRALDWLRAKIKYEDREELEEVRDKLFEFIEQQNQ